jgi:outer membrane protein OmpA-like peptidoglycan-associated protein
MFNFEIPRSTDPIIDLGKISCESTPGGGLPPPAAPPPQKTEKTLSAPVSAPVSEKVAAAPELWQAGQPLPLKKADDVAPSKTVVPRLPIDADISVPEEIVLHFRFGSDKFSSNDDVAEILKVARLLQTAAGLSVSLEGYTDQIGSVEYNLQLGKKRAFRVERELLKDGVDSKKITAVTSFGKKQLKCRSLREKCRKQNRRVIVYINRN